MSRFDRVASATAEKAGSSRAFTGALGVLLLWAVTGPLLGFSDTWQLIINTGTTIVTFLMVFLIQHSENKSSLALHTKLDEVLRALDGADDALVELDQAPDDVVREIRTTKENP